MLPSHLEWYHSNLIFIFKLVYPGVRASYVHAWWPWYMPVSAEPLNFAQVQQFNGYVFFVGIHISVPLTTKHKNANIQYKVEKTWVSIFPLISFFCHPGILEVAIKVNRNCCLQVIPRLTCMTKPCDGNQQSSNHIEIDYEEFHMAPLQITISLMLQMM